MRNEFDPLVGATEADARAEQIALQRVDETSATPQPDTIAHSWVVPEYEELRDEQPLLHAAAGLEASRQLQREAAGLNPSAVAAERVVAGHRTVLEASERRAVETTDALAAFRRRPPKAKCWHLLAKSAFLLGDIAGISTAAIWLGEIPAIAVVMATSAAAATVAAGLSGGEVRDVRNRERRARPASELSDALQPFAHLFEAPDRGWRFVKAVTWVSVGIAGTIATAIFALRASIEDPLIGLVFGGIAAAIAAASWTESFSYADDVADLIDHADADYQRERERHLKLATNPDWKRHEETVAEADSTTREQERRGEAAAHHVRALRYGILRRNPNVAGNGPAVEPTAIGQTARRGGAK